MPEYVLGHHLKGEGKRLALMSELLDPMPRLAALGIEKIGGTAETAIYNWTSLWAVYWIQTIRELREDLTSSGKLSTALVDTFLGHCADPTWWTQTIAFTAVHGYAPGR